ncbi:hydroxyacid dehydrogenase [Streptomyces sp. CBMA29]|uniref:hydroxyacid dehydrogenase n=1 Tax=Streptomyces sp. CBMA29 TaxID=1896314 RepID=UPI001661C833|nr:hydroxyacid dehydrogenase [Streptomyces sp. CBMA29]MBD0735689.1 hydroxyacid dehydrogenase [Streptomyces sp. CBMA29]
MSERPVALFAMSAEVLNSVYPPDLMDRLRTSVDISPVLVTEDFHTPQARRALAGAEILLSGWGCPHIDDTVLDAAPGLRAVLHAGGSVKGIMASGWWDRGLVVSSASAANALPVAEYTLGMIMLAGKDLFAARERYRAQRTFTIAEITPGIGNFGRRVGIVGASRIGRRLIELLRPFDFQVLLADPYVGPSEAAALGVRLLPLDELLRTSDIVTVHAPALPETHRMIGRRELELMPERAVLINTARGSLVDTDALVTELRRGRISAVLDVTEPEPLSAGSPLFDLPNAFLTPHLAGSQGNEVRRMGQYVADELERLLAGLPLAHRVDPADLDRAA